MGLGQGQDGTKITKSKVGTEKVEQSRRRIEMRLEIPDQVVDKLGKILFLNEKKCNFDHLQHFGLMLLGCFFVV